MATLLKLTCPKCGHTWEVDYARLQQDHRLIHKSLHALAAHNEEYIIRCPNPNHGEEVVITVHVEE